MNSKLLIMQSRAVTLVLLLALCLVALSPDPTAMSATPDGVSMNARVHVRTPNTDVGGDLVVKLRPVSERSWATRGASLSRSLSAWRRKRFTARASITYDFLMYRRQDGALVLTGWSKFLVRSLARSSNGYSTWWHEVHFKQLRSWGEATTIRISTHFGCISNCRRTRGGQQFTLGPSLRRWSDLGMFEYNKGVNTQGPIGTRFWFKVSDHLNRKSTSSTPLHDPGVKCDRLRYLGRNGRCRIPAIPPTFKLRLRGKFPQSAAHILAAQRRLRSHPGARGLGGRPLRRYHWDGRKNQNRAAALRRCRKLPDVGSCDEFPFASTRQGCYWDPCSVRKIRLPDNRGSGAALGRFYKRSRVVSGDKFWVKIVK